MADARGEKIVMSAPRSRSSRSWLFSSVFPNLVVRDRRVGRRYAGNVEGGLLCLAPFTVRLWRCGVVAVAVDDEVHDDRLLKGGKRR